MSHKMRSDVVAALERFVAGVNKDVPGVSIDMKGQLDSRRNTVIPHAPGKKYGSRLIISVGDPMSGGAVTNYGLHVPNLGKRNDSARSLRLTKEDGTAVSVLTGIPQEGIEGVSADRQAGDRLEAAYARAANSMSFGNLYTDDPLELFTPDMREGSSLIAGINSLMDKGKGGVMEVMKGGAADGLDGSDPLDRMAAWSACSCAGLLGGTQDDIGPATDIGVKVASRVLGLNALRSALERVGAGEALEDVLTCDTQEGRDALSGLACLGYYKCVMNEGKDFGVMRSGRVYAGTADDRESVFTRGAFARHESEVRSREESSRSARRDAVAPYYCYMKMLGGMPTASGGAAMNEDVAREETGADAPRKRSDKQKVNMNLYYRFYRCAMTGEDPDGPSNAPVAKLTYRGNASLKKADLRQIYVDVPGVPADKMRTLSEELSLLKSDMDSPGQLPRSRLHGLPAIAQAVSVSGPDALLDAAGKLVSTDYSIGPDILELELAMFKDDEKAGARSRTGRPGELTADSMWVAYKKAAIERASGAPVYTYTLDHAAGVPDFANGVADFGELWTAGADAQRHHMDGFLRPRTKGNGRMAESFRTMDADRIYMSGLLGREPGQPWKEATAGFAGAAPLYLAARDEAAADPDRLRGSMRINDIMVMTEAYRPSDAQEMGFILEDVSQAYQGCPRRGLYRPTNSAELKAIRSLTAGGFADAPLIAPELQGTTEAFLETVNGLLDSCGPGERQSHSRELHDIFVQEALARDTFTDTTYTDMAARFDVDAQDVGRAPMSRQSVLDALMEKKDEVDQREAERAAGVPGRDVTDS